MDETLIKRVLPHSLEAEQAVVGSMLMDKEAIVTVSEILSKEDFYQTAYGEIFEAIVEIYNAGTAVDLVTLQAKLKEKDLPSQISSLEFVRDLVTAVPTSANVKHYAKIVSEQALRRRLIKAGEDIENMCYLGKEPIESVIDKTEKRVFELVQSKGSGEITPIRDVVISALEKIEQAAKSGDSVTGIPTGFTDLDKKLAGLQPSDFILIAARPSMGKTAFVLNIAQHAVLRENKAVAIFSLEMSKESLVNRMLALEGHVDASKLRVGDLKDSDWEKLVEAAGSIGKSRLYIDETSGISISDLRSKCRKLKLEKGLDLVIIDYLQLMSGSGSNRNASRENEIAEISRSLKGLARELNVPVIALSQLNRAAEQRSDHKPMLSDLRESGSIEQDADVVMLIHREDYYNPDTENKNVAEINVAKQRNGAVGIVKLTWLPQYTKFANYRREEGREQ